MVGIDCNEWWGLVPTTATECIVWNKMRNTEIGRLRREPVDIPAARMTFVTSDGETTYERKTKGDR